MTHLLENSNSSACGDILLLKIKIEFPTVENLETMAFRCLKTLVVDKFFKISSLFDAIFEEYYY